MKKILSLLFFVAIAAFANAQEPAVKLYGGVTSDGSLVFKFKNDQGDGAKTICSCSFQLTFPEGVGVKPKGKKYEYEEGDATEDFTYSVAFKNGKYTVAVYDGEFDETDGKHTIISLPLEGTLAGSVQVTTINFADGEGDSLGRDNDGFSIDLATAINGISAEQTKSGAIYNMAGQRVSKANKGIYVVDGKKVAVK
jgi:hypothetical protein